MSNKSNTHQVPQVGSDLPWADLTGCQSSLKLAEFSDANNVPVIIIANNNAHASQLQHELHFFLSTDRPVNIFSDWETLPYDHFSPHQDIISERLKLLQQLPSMNQGIVIIAVNTLLQRLAPVDYVEAHSLVIDKQQTLNLANLRERFIRCGYHQVEQVLQHGEYAVRGSILDIFPMGSKQPYRIDLFDDEIDSIRLFNPETQRSEQQVDCINLLPAREFPLDDTSISLFRQQWRTEFEGNPMLSNTYQAISEGLTANGIEYYLPLFYKHTASFFDYLPNNSSIFYFQDFTNMMQHAWKNIQERYEQLRFDTSRPLLSPYKCFTQSEVIIDQLNRFSVETLCDKENTLDFTSKNKNGLDKLHNYLNEINKRVLLVAESLGHRESLLEKLLPLKLKPEIIDSWQQFLIHPTQLAITVAKLSTGCELDNAVIIAESQLTGQKAQYTKKSTSNYQDASNIIRSLTELKIGEAIVHIDHGVGRFLGLSMIRDAEFVTIEYAEQNKLYVPVTNLHLISRYGGVDAENIPLNNLGNDQWEKAREKAAKRAHDVAAELLELHAQRASKPGKQFTLDKLVYQQFASNFPFDLTPDQQQTIEQIIADMTSTKAMDRLVCGDVGFGKTEVAMRAAFIAATNNKQVAMLVPTTLLAQQHFETFNNRFTDTAIRIEVLSRFNTPKQQQQILDNLSKGKVDIVIGTHKLLQENIKFHDLGLLIIDEEHRFGVRQKERIKAMRAEVDLLTLTATPIPRTLNMALSDVRDLSIIGTPPAKRLSVKTFLHEYDSVIIREAVMREIMRGGQVFYLHNNVKTIEQRARELQQLMPDAKIDIAHGQMAEKQLEAIMSNFYHQRSNILVCTTIIENGIDIPTANTIIIERADKLGLAQLHQLRGRVGRSHHQAYAYLLTPPKSVMTKDAEKRLEAISSLEDLGIGFTLATHDLEIRGAGEFLGGEQSGHIQNIGFSLYMEFLDRAVESLKSGGKIDFGKPLIHTTEVSLNIATLIPEAYIPDVHTRLILYKRIANANNNDALKQLQIEMIDRFGLLPEPVKNLFMVTELKLLAERCDIHKVSVHGEFIYLDFNKQADIDPMIILNLIQSKPGIYKMDGAERLRVKIDTTETIETQLTNLFNTFCKN